MKIGTKLLHTGFETDKYTGAASIPIHHASSFHQDSINKKNEYFYSRVKNPTREALENAAASLENGTDGFAFASGMAAISSVLSIFNSGDHIIACSDIYGGAYKAFTGLFPRFGISISFVNTTDLNLIKNAVKENTKAIYIETPSNPIMRVTDIEQTAEIANQNNLYLIVDNTFMTPYLQNPLDLGADIVIHSATKFLGGHSDVLAGLVVIKDSYLAEKISDVQKSFGAVLGPQESWLVMRGIKTLKIRLDKQQENAEKITQWLKKQKKITGVFFPGLSDHSGYDIHKKQARGPGCVVSFKVENRDMIEQIVSSMKLPIFGASLGGVETILSYPAKMSHAAIPSTHREKIGITENLLRLSVGIEEIEDLISDLETALNQ